jgi:glycosyltransferase involved in cell wall biosynthesis
MRILLLVDCYLPSTKSSAKLIHDLALEMRALDHDVVVAAPDPGLETRCSVGVEEGITVLRARTGQIKGAVRVLRALNEARLSAVMWRAGRSFFREHPCDLIVYYSPTIFFGELVRRLKQLWNCPSYLILRDIFPQWAVDAGVLRRGSLPHRFFRRKELQQYDVADVIGVQSPANLHYFEQEGLAGRYRLEVLWHWAPRSHGELPRTNLRGELGLEGKVVFFYGGNIGVAQDMDNVLRLAESLRDEPDLYFLVLGEGSEVPRLKRTIASKGLSNVSIHSALDQKKYLAVLSEFDVGLITLDRGLRTQNLPGKMLGYMYFGMPTLASINPGNDLKQVLEEHDCGLVCINGEDERFRELALRLAREPELRRRIGENGRRLLSESFSTHRAATQILSHASAASRRSDQRPST